MGALVVALPKEGKGQYSCDPYSHVTTPPRPISENIVTKSSHAILTFFFHLFTMHCNLPFDLKTFWTPSNIKVEYFYTKFFFFFFFGVPYPKG
jgi:hypothetical protein